MLSLEEVRRQLQDRRIPVVAAATGLHPSTVRRVVKDADFVPTYETVRALSDYLEESAKGVAR